MKPTVAIIVFLLIPGSVEWMLGCDPDTPSQARSTDHTSNTPAPVSGDPEVASIDARLRAATVLARRMREDGIGLSITTHGKDHTVLRLSGPACGSQTLADFARESAQHLRELGFERIECHGGRFERAEMRL
jgi:hypothetical protein